MKVEVWFEFASTYSYLTVSRAEEAFRRAGVGFEWKPFLLGPIFRAKGWETSPFILDEAKGTYMWRDMERRAERYELPFRRPAVFPAPSLLAARVMTAALGTPWCGAFARDVFRAEFGHGADIADPEDLKGVLASHVVDPGEWLNRAQSDPVKAQLRQQTESAAGFGIFGAPSFRVGGELFWGDDRLEDAIAWAKGPTKT